MDDRWQGYAWGGGSWRSSQMPGQRVPVSECSAQRGSVVGSMKKRGKGKMGLANASQSWRMPNELWAKVKPLLPAAKPHPLGCHRPRVHDRKAMDAIFYRLRTGCQWKALDTTGICSSSSAHRRFQEWTQSRVFLELWAQGLLSYDEHQGIEWEWQAMDGAMTKAPLGQEETGPNPPDRAQRRGKRSLLVAGPGLPICLAGRGAEH